MTRKCVQCGKTFELTEEDIKFYKDKGYSLPKRCENCRKINRRKKEKEEQGNRQESSIYGGYGMNSNGGQNKGNFSHSGGNKNDNKLKRILYICCAALILLIAAGGNSLIQNFKDNGIEDRTTTGYAGEIHADSDKGETKASDLSQEDETQITQQESSAATVSKTYKYRFRKEQYLQEHFEKHGAEFGYETAEEYLAGANSVILADDSLHKTEKEDGDDIYFQESTGAIVFVSTDGYIRTYFIPDDGIDYYNRQ